MFSGPSRRPRRFRGISVRLRLTSLFVAIFGVTLLAFSALIYSVFTRNMEAAFDADLYNHAVDVAQGIEADWLGNLSLNSQVISQVMTGAGKILPFSAGNSLLELRATDGRVLARSRSLGMRDLPLSAADLAALEVPGGRGVELRTIRFAGPRGGVANHRLLTYLVTKERGLSFILQIGAPMSLIDQENDAIMAFFAFMIPLALVLAAVGGMVLSKRALRPVVDMIDQTDRIDPARLTQPGLFVKLPGGLPENDEIRRLARTLNGLLERLQAAFETQERFIADASHQLKTPLAILRGELDVLRRGEPSREEMGAFLESASQELTHLSRMVEDLLLLARIGAGEAALQIRPVRLDEVALEAVSRLQPMARAMTPAAQIQFGLDLEHGEPEFEVPGDPDLLRSLLQSLIENAVKYGAGPDGAPAQVEVRVASEADWVWVRVRDQGPGIPEAEHAKIFERFYRGSGRAAASARGTGLGLAIAKLIAQAHGGLLLVESEPGRGSVFSFGMRRTSGA